MRLNISALRHVLFSHIFMKERIKHVNQLFQMVLLRGVDGGSRCRMSIIRKGNVALSNLRNIPVALSKFKKQSCRPVEFKKQPCRMSLRPKKGRVALSILGVHTPY